MTNRQIAFVLTSTDHGTLIVNRNDYHTPSVIESWYTPDEDGDYTYGIGQQILKHGSFEPEEVQTIIHLLDYRKKYFGNRVIAIDGGANIGIHTIEWAKHMNSWGSVLSFEAQEIIFYALAGNIVLNNCLNAKAKNMALGSHCGELYVPRLDYFKPANYGALEIKEGKNESIGQSISYNEKDCDKIAMLSVDSLNLPRLDLLKLDIEGMEDKALKGAECTIKQHKPIIVLESTKTNNEFITDFLICNGYIINKFGINIIAIHNADKSIEDFKNEI